MRAHGDAGVTVIEPTEGTSAGNAVRFRAWGWPVSQVGMTLALETTSGFCGVEIPQPQADNVLRQLQKVDAQGPVIRTFRPTPWLLFLAEADVVVDADLLRPYQARLVHRGDRIPLPPAVSHTSRSTWAVPPRPDRRWLPGLSTIVWALKSARLNHY
jgi:hypothetical protein